MRVDEASARYGLMAIDCGTWPTEQMPRQPGSLTRSSLRTTLPPQDHGSLRPWLESPPSAKSRTQRWGGFWFYYGFLCLPPRCPCQAATGRSSTRCAWGSTAIRLQVWQSKFSPDGEGKRGPSPQTGQRLPGLAVGDTVWRFMGASTSGLCASGSTVVGGSQSGNNTKIKPSKA